MQIQTRHSDELTDGELAAWHGLIAQHSQFDSPFFSPQYIRELAAVRDRIEVAVMTEDGCPVGFLPFERHRRRVGRPPGVKLCDFQGVVTAPDTRWAVDELIAGAGLSVLHFDHLISSPSPLSACAVRADPSSFIDISGGYEAWLEERKRSCRSRLTQALRKRRKLEREHGRIEFCWHDSGEEPWDRLMEWKAAQRVRTRTLDILNWQWVREFLNRMRNLDSDGLCGAMSTLRVDGRLVAVHLGMHTPSVFHQWFPAYDREFHRYSPGLLLLLELTGGCAERGIGRMDLGKGDEDYKEWFASGTASVLTGAADRNPVRRVFRDASHRAWTWIRQSRVRRPIDLPRRILRNLQNRLAME